MSKRTKYKPTEATFLSLLEKVLPANAEPEKAGAIYEAVAKALRLEKNIHGFLQFCEHGAIADLEDATLANFREEMEAKFGADSTALSKDEPCKRVNVTITLPDRTLSGEVRVDATIALGEEKVVAPWVPFPFSLPGDPDNVWMLARREDFGPDEAARALGTVEAEFWETKKGLNLQKKRVEKCFAEFIQHVPASALKDSGMKRHYKEPEVVKTAGAEGVSSESVNSNQSSVSGGGQSSGGQEHYENSVGLSKRMYDIRRTVRQLMGAEYGAIMLVYKSRILECVEATGLDELKAMVKLCEACSPGDPAVDALVAAYVEMIEPSEVRG